MNPPNRIGAVRLAHHARWPRRCVQGTLVLMLSVPAVAHPMSLNELLRMPLEQLLRLEITAAKPPLPAMPRAERGR